MTDIIKFTRFTASAPINKKITQAEDGNLIKESLAHQAYMGNFIAEVRSVNNVIEFGHCLDILTENQCHSYGIPKDHDVESAVQIVTKDQEEKKPQPNQISRTRANFHFAEAQPGIMMIDYDPPPDGHSLTPDELIAVIKVICPELQNVEMLHRPSASSNILDENNEWLRRIAGQRLYIIVSDASLIPKYAELIKSRCWLTDHGRFDVSRAGSLLERGLFDFCVNQPERLDFCGKTVLGSGLKQIKPPSRVIPGDHQSLDISTISLTITAEEQVKIDTAKQIAKAAVSEERNRVRNLYTKEKIQVQIEKEGISPDDQTTIDKIRRNVKRAVENKILYADFEIYLQDGGIATVGELLDRPEKYHMCQCYDPLEPEYGNNNPRIGVIRLHGGRPSIYSHAHGGQIFRLVRAAQEIELSDGDSPRIVHDCVEILALDGETFVYGEGDNTVLVNAPTPNFGIQSYTQETLALKLDECINFYRYRRGNNEEAIRVIKDCPTRLAKTILEASNYWLPLPRLNAVITNPICRSDGSIAATEGYDKATKLFLVKPDPDDDWFIDPEPSMKDIVEAVNVLLHPFRLFPFEKAVDRAVFLSAQLTSVVRAVIATAPGYLSDATCPGTGKTLLAQCLGTMQSGHVPPAVAPPASEEEMQKVLLSSLLTGSQVLLIDNLEVPLRSASLCGLLTSDSFGGRILGVSKTVNLPNRMGVLFTGNNVQILGDLNRRVLRIRLVADVERPEKRKFDFCPLEYTKSHRLEMIKAALTVIRGATIYNKDQPHDVGSYREWNQLVRHPILWLIKHKPSEVDFFSDIDWWRIPDLVDPMESFDAGFDADPELQNLSSLLSVLWEVFAGREFTVADIVTASQAYHFVEPRPKYQGLSSVINEIAADHNNVSTKKLGRYLKRYTGRIVGGLALVSAGKNLTTKTNMFKIESKPESIPGVSGVSGVSLVQHEKISKIVNINGQNQIPVIPITPESVQNSQNISE